MLAAHQLALAGDGIALLPDFMIKTDLERGNPAGLLPEYLLKKTDAWIASSLQRYRLIAVQTVLNYLPDAAQ